MYIPWKNICKVIVQIAGLSFILLFLLLLIYLLVVWSLVVINIISFEFTLLNVWDTVLGAVEVLFIFPLFFIMSSITLSTVLLLFRYVFWNARRNPSLSKKRKKVLLITSLILFVVWIIAICTAIYIINKKLEREAYERESIPIIYFSEGMANR